MVKKSFLFLVHNEQKRKIVKYIEEHLLRFKKT